MAAWAIDFFWLLILPSIILTLYEGRQRVYLKHYESQDTWTLLVVSCLFLLPSQPLSTLMDPENQETRTQESRNQQAVIAILENNLEDPLGNVDPDSDLRICLSRPKEDVRSISNCRYPPYILAEICTLCDGKRNSKTGRDKDGIVEGC